MRAGFCVWRWQAAGRIQGCQQAESTIMPYSNNKSNNTERLCDPIEGLLIADGVEAGVVQSMGAFFVLASTHLTKFLATRLAPLPTKYWQHRRSIKRLAIAGVACIFCMACMTYMA